MKIRNSDLRPDKNSRPGLKVEDFSERCPKTDYTYSRSLSYTPQGMHKDYTPPNMSRHRISPVKSGSIPSPVRSNALRSLCRPDFDENESFLQQQPNVDAASLPPSATRSGKKYGAAWQKRRRSLHRSDRSILDSVANGNLRVGEIDDTGNEITYLYGLDKDADGERSDEVSVSWVELMKLWLFPPFSSWSSNGWRSLALCLAALVLFLFVTSSTSNSPVSSNFQDGVGGVSNERLDQQIQLALAKMQKEQDAKMDAKNDGLLAKLRAELAAEKEKIPSFDDLKLIILDAVKKQTNTRHFEDNLDLLELKLQQSLTAVVKKLEESEQRMLVNIDSRCENSSVHHSFIKETILKELSREKLAFKKSMSEWITQNFVRNSEAKNMFEDITEKLLERNKLEIETKSPEPGSSRYSHLDEDSIHRIVNEALATFSADRIGVADYALETAGGSVISTRCSETYHRRTAQLSLFGIPLWYAYNSPRTIIQPDVLPGQCWAFKGQVGYVVIHLSTRIRPTSFSLEHIPPSLSATGKTESAPKDFSVLGLTSAIDQDGVILGNYSYDAEGTALQRFPVQTSETRSFELVELRVKSNQGHGEYTCIYRFRVHGTMVAT